MEDEDISHNGVTDLPFLDLLKKLACSFTGNFWGRVFEFETDGVSFMQIYS